MPTTSGPREVPEAFAGELADLFGIEQDLGASKAYCERIKQEWRDPKTADWLVINGLSEAAVVRYARCFTKGRRFKLDESWVSSELLLSHRYHWSLRNKHIAHPVNDYEQSFVTVHVIEPPSTPLVQNVGMGNARVGGFMPETADELIRLCDSLLYQLRPRIEQVRQEVERAIHTLSVDEVYSWPIPQLVSPTGRQRPQRRAS